MSYPPAPPPPPGPPLGAVPEKMPGTTKGAVVLLWIVFGFGICGGGALVFGYSVLASLEEQGDAVIPDSYMPFMIASIVQLLIWTVLRAVFAVKIAHRSAGARKGAIILESVGVLLSIVSWLITPDIEMTGANTTSNTAGSVVGALIGIALAAIIIGLLSTADSKRWCSE
jgi:hypothetical protein